MKILLVLILCLGLIGCASVKLDKNGRPVKFYGYGKYKAPEGEIESKTPLADILGVKIGNLGGDD